MSTISDLIELALQSTDRDDTYRAFQAILTCTNTDELVTALSVADPIFKLAINARIDQLALEEYLAAMADISKKQSDMTEELITAHKERAPKLRTGLGFGRT